MYCITRQQDLHVYNVSDGKLVYNNKNLKIKDLVLSRKGNLIGITDDKIYLMEDNFQMIILSQGHKRLSHLVQDPITEMFYVYDDTQLEKFDFKK